MDYNLSGKGIETSIYMSSMRPVLNRKALFSDYSEDYIHPLEPTAYGSVTLRIRTAKNNIDNAYVIINGERNLMDYEFTNEGFDYYSFEYQLNNEHIEFYYEVVCGKQRSFYNIKGPCKNIEPYFNFKLRPGFKTPEWAKGAVMYQLYVDRFYNGDKTNDVESGEYFYVGDRTDKVTDWNKYPATMGVREFYGGDLQGVIDKMDYLKNLGVDVLYFNPLFVSPSNHKYDIQDYDYIDPHFGKIVADEGDCLPEGNNENRFATKYINRVTNKANLEASNEVFIKVVKEAHKRGMRVILDGVFNHCGSFNKWMDRERIYENSKDYEKGAYISADSPYRSFFKFFSEDASNWPYNNSYDGWWGHDTLPKLNYEESPTLFEYVMRIAEKWVSPPYNADGWRLDVAADLGHSPEYNHYFWKEFRKRVKRANPEAIIIAEHYGDPSQWLLGDEWDSIMNYDAFMEPLTWFLTGMQKHSDDFRPELLGNADFYWDMMYSNYTKFSAPSIYVSMNQLSNHDHSRFLTRTNHVVGRVADKGSEAANEGVNKAVFREAILVQLTWVGAPTIYYGDEAGVCGFTDPDNRRTYPWGREDNELIEFHREMIRIRKSHPELLKGSTTCIHKDYNILAYGRFTIDRQCAIIVNNNDYDKELDVNLLTIGVPWESAARRLMYTDENGFSVEEEVYPVTNGRLKIHLPKTSAVVLEIQAVD